MQTDKFFNPSIAVSRIAINAQSLPRKVINPFRHFQPLRDKLEARLQVAEPCGGNAYHFGGKPWHFVLSPLSKRQKGPVPERRTFLANRKWRSFGDNPG